MPRRFDRSPLESTSKLPNGYLRAPAVLTRTGVFTYRMGNGKELRELRLPEEVFHPDTLQSFSLSPLTLEHPPEALDAKNTGKYQVGITGEHPYPDGELMKTTVVVMDAAAVADAESGKRRELSCGYDCDLEIRPGEWNGQAYDAIQRNIRGNHVALVTRGRAGPEARIRLDAEDAEQVEPSALPSPKPGAKPMEQELVINGVTYKVNAQVAQAIAVERQRKDAELAELKGKAETATGKVDAAQAKVDALTEDLKKEKAAREDALSPTKIQEVVAKRVALISAAKAILGEEAEGLKLDSLDEKAIKLAVLKHVSPELKVEGQSDAYIQGRFDHAVEMATEHQDGPPEEEGDEEETPPAARARAHAAPVPARRPARKDEGREDEEDSAPESSEEAAARFKRESQNAWKKGLPGFAERR